MLPDPELSLEYEALPGALGFDRFGERSFGVSQTLEFPAKPYLRGRIGEQEAQAAWLEYEAVQVEVATEVRKACGRFWAAQDILGYAQESLKLADEFREKTRKRLEAGDASRLETLRAGVEVGRVEAEVATAKNQAQLARAALNTLLNQDLFTPIEVDGELTYTPMDAELQALWQMALEHRPDVRAARAAVEGAEAGQSLAHASLLPDLDLWMGRQTIRREGDFSRIGFTLTLPLWAAARQRGEIASARAEVVRAEAEQVGKRTQVLLEVQEAYLNVKTAEQRLLLYRDRVLPGAGEGYQVSRRRYDEGTSSYLEVIDAGQTLAETRTAYVEALLDYHVAMAELTRAVGGRMER
jgi:outer membrane protein TolC